MKKLNETMIIRSGKLLYGVSLANNTEGNCRTAYIYIDNGKVCFSDGYLERHEFDFGNESHRIAKEIFMTELQTDIKRKVLELKQLQSVFEDLNLTECLGSVLADNTKLLLEVRNEVEKVASAVEGTATKGDLKQAITETVRPFALRKGNLVEDASATAEEST